MTTYLTANSTSYLALLDPRWLLQLTSTITNLEEMEHHFDKEPNNRVCKNQCLYSLDFFAQNFYVNLHVHRPPHVAVSVQPNNKNNKNKNVITVRTWLWNPSKPPPTNKLWSSRTDSLPQTPTAVLYQVITADRWGTWPISHPLAVCEARTGKDRQRLSNCALILSFFRWK